MKITLLPSLAAVCILSAATQAAKLPATWKTCRINQPDTGACLKKNIQAAIDELAVKGSPSLGVYPIDPLTVNRLELSSGTGTVSLDIIFSNLDMYGFSGIRIDQANGDFANGRLQLELTILSDLRLEGDYTVNGRLVVVPIVGSGRCNITLGKPVAASIDISWKLQKGSDGRTFAHVEKFQFDFAPKTFKLHFHDKDHGNTQLGKTLNKVANDNSKEILRDLTPSIAIAFGQAFKDVANRIFMKIPYSQLFPNK